MTLEPPTDQASAGTATTVPGSVPETTPAHPSGRTLPDICYTLRRKVDAFLQAQTDDEVLRNVQTQARVSVGVIREALQRYGWVPPLSALALLLHGEAALAECGINDTHLWTVARET